MQLTTGVFWSEPWHAQIGIDPRIGISLDGLSHTELAFIDTLTRPQEDVELQVRAEAAGISRRRLARLLAMLERAGVLDRQPSGGVDHIPWRRIRRAVPDRGQRHVHIARADYLGAGIAIALARCGVGKITTEDPGVVSFNDHPAMTTAGLGHSRAQTLKTLLRREYPKIRTSGVDFAVRPPDLAVVSGVYATDPVTVGMLLSQSIPVYQAWIEEVDVYAGPLSIPHETACGTCLMLHRTDLDPHWPVLIQQACTAAPLVPEMTSAMMAISLAVRDIVAWLDGSPAPDMWRVGPAPLAPEPLVLPPHPRCGCTALGTAA
ncbi:hypothetical protein [Trueperella pyogenes]|uniref:hypothetical protein n=1 Tax=Trueperella pyogenes TaxID=1661 RepID=UPI00345CFA3C